MINLIRLDARVVGAVEYMDHGIGLIEWFHTNKSSCSMDYAIKHEGYSVDVAADLDCRDVEGCRGV